MVWLRFDDAFPEHPKIVGLSDAAFRLQVTAIAYSSRNLTDGRIPAGAVRSLGFMPKHAAELVAANVWEKAEKDYQIHDYGDYQPSRRQVEEWRTERSEVKSRAGKLGAQARWGGRQDDGKPDGKRVADDWQTGWQMDSPDPDPDPMKVIPKDIDLSRRAGARADERETYLDGLDPGQRDLFGEIENRIGVRKAWDDPRTLTEIRELVEDYPADRIREGLAVCRKENKQPWPSNVRGYLIGPKEATNGRRSQPRNAPGAIHDPTERGHSPYCLECLAARDTPATEPS